MATKSSPKKTKTKTTKSKSPKSTSMGSKFEESKSKMPARGSAKDASQVDDNQDLEEFEDEDET